jgi:methionyl-tRNA formyltransferase
MSEPRSLRIVFMGTPEFAVASLDALMHSRHQIVGVVTVADKPAGRGRQVQMSAVKNYAVEHRLPVAQPEKLRDTDFLNQLTSWNADLFVVVAFRMLPEVVWSMPPLGTINLHGSLLPKYRGAAPINWAMINGEKETGVTTFFLQHEIDTGKVIKRATLHIGPDETAGELHDSMMALGALTLKETVDLIADGRADAVAQEMLQINGEEVCHAPKIFKEDCKIDWSKAGFEIHNFIRGLSPYPAAWTMIGDKSLKIFTGNFIPGNPQTPGEYSTDQKSLLKFACADGWYAIKELQFEGKKRMGVEEFLRGWRP